MLAEKRKKKLHAFSGNFAKFFMRCVVRLEGKNTAAELAESSPRPSRVSEKTHTEEAATFLEPAFLRLAPLEKYPPIKGGLRP